MMSYWCHPGNPSLDLETAVFQQKTGLETWSVEFQKDIFQAESFLSRCNWVVSLLKPSLVNPPTLWKCCPKSLKYPFKLLFKKRTLKLKLSKEKKVNDLNTAFMFYFHWRPCMMVQSKVSWITLGLCPSVISAYHYTPPYACLLCGH